MTGVPGLSMTLDEAVAEVLNRLTGLDLTYLPELDRYRSITRMINRALRRNAMESDWSYYSALLDLGSPTAGSREVYLPRGLRPRIVQDDAVRLVDHNQHPHVWAYYLPREAIHKYDDRKGLWCSSTGDRLIFSRPFTEWEASLGLQLTIMREPRMVQMPTKSESIEDLLEPSPLPSTITDNIVQVRNFQYPDVIETWVFNPGEVPYQLTDPEGSLEGLQLTPRAIRDQLIDFEYPDLITLLAAVEYAQTDPLLQPRVQTLEQQYKDFKFQVIGRDDSKTDMPYINDFNVPIHNSVHSTHYGWGERHPRTDERY